MNVHMLSTQLDVSTFIQYGAQKQGIVQLTVRLYLSKRSRPSIAGTPTGQPNLNNSAFQVIQKLCQVDN